jgi:SAM-dependent methyltransferase/uncharacterized protein YbaR (Trm112 family)
MNATQCEAPPFVCPINKTPLEFVTAERLETLRDRTGTLSLDIKGAYVSSAGVAYPVQDGIFNFIIPEAIPLAGRMTRIPKTCENNNKSSVRHWYEEFGWKKDESGVYLDSALFSSIELVPEKIYEILSHLSLLERLGKGRFILNAGSGPLPHREHSIFTLFFDRQVCVDFSRRALLEAQQKLGTSATYVLADLCHLPFPDNTFDGIVSLYTIQHIDEAEQDKAVAELVRVLNVGNHLVIVNNNHLAGIRKRLRALILAPFKILTRTRSFRSLFSKESKQVDVHHKEPCIPDLYCRNKSIEWWKKQSDSNQVNIRVESFRILDNLEAGRFFAGVQFRARSLFALERLMPQMLAHISRYLLIDIEKRPKRETTRNLKEGPPINP